MKALPIAIATIVVAGFALYFFSASRPAAKSDEAIPATAQASKAGWSNNYEASLAKAKAENRKVLLDFTGSDWCEGCIRVQKEIFDTPEFKKYAETNLVLVELDFPIGKTLPPPIKQQNDKLLEQYKVQGYPTFIILDSQGTKIGELRGFAKGGPAEFIAEVEKLKNP